MSYCALAQKLWPIRSARTNVWQPQHDCKIFPFSFRYLTATRSCSCISSRVSFGEEWHLNGLFLLALASKWVLPWKLVVSHWFVRPWRGGDRYVIFPRTQRKSPSYERLKERILSVMISLRPKCRRKHITYSLDHSSMATTSQLLACAAEQHGKPSLCKSLGHRCLLPDHCYAHFRSAFPGDAFPIRFDSGCVRR